MEVSPVASEGPPPASTVSEKADEAGSGPGAGTGGCKPVGDKDGDTGGGSAVTQDLKARGQYLGPVSATPLAIVRQLLQFAGVGPQDTVYDIGCGDGKSPASLAPPYRSAAHHRACSACVSGAPAGRVCVTAALEFDAARCCGIEACALLHAALLRLSGDVGSSIPAAIAILRMLSQVLIPGGFMVRPLHSGGHHGCAASAREGACGCVTLGMP